jgi:hypothetical protein
MPTTTPFATRGGAPLREVGEVAPRMSRTGAVVAVFVSLLVVLPLATLVPSAAVIAVGGLWLVFRIGLRDGRLS